MTDDKGYFPPYYVAPIVNGETLDKHPELLNALSLLENTLNNNKMAELNYQVDSQKKELEVVANQFLKELNIYANPNAGTSRGADIVIGSKAFTESFLLAHIIAQLIENKTALTTQLALGFGGTKLIFDALKIGDIDLYAEYTGTGFLVLLQKKPKDVSDFTNPKEIYQDVKKEFRKEYNIHWMTPLGFNNSFAIMMRTQHADSLGITTVSDLSEYLNSK